MSKGIIEIISWIILAALAVLVVMNASKVATVVTSVGGFWTTETSMFTGSNYGNSNYGKAA
ncbi:MAG: hypothetical protein ACRETA_04485 [Gammaproteobacteria bacterium]